MKLRIRPDLVLDCAGVAGGGLVAFGIWLIYPPAAIIFVGVGILAIAYLVARWVS